MARFDAKRLPILLKAPGPLRAVVLFGEDAGLVRERADALQAAVVRDDDPFRLADLPREVASRPGALAGEAAALALTGGRRVVRVRDATDAVAGPLKEALAGPGASPRGRRGR